MVLMNFLKFIKNMTKEMTDINTDGAPTITPLSETTLMIIYASKTSLSSDVFTYDFMQKLLGEKYHSNIGIKNIFYICLKSCMEVIENNSSENMEFIQKLCFAPEDLFEPTKGSNKLYPDKSDTITFDKLYTDYLITMLNFLRLTRVSNLPGYDDYRTLHDSKKKSIC